MDDIVNYVMNTPANTNPNVLKGLLNKNSSGGGSIFWVEVSGTSNGSSITWEKASHTAVEIVDAYNQFEFPILRVSMTGPGGSTVFYACVYQGVVDDQGKPVAVFSIMGEGQLLIDYQGRVTIPNS